MLLFARHLHGLFVFSGVNVDSSFTLLLGSENGSAHLDEKGENLIIIDQTLLPNRRVLLTINTAEALYEAIASLRVRGAPAIGIAAATVYLSVFIPLRYFCI